MGERVSIQSARAGVAAALLALVGLCLVESTALSSPAELARDEIDERMYLGSYPEAEDKARATLAALKANGQDGSEAAAWYADRLVEAMLAGRRGPKPEAIAWARHAVVLNERLFGAADPVTARSQIRLGRVHATRGEFTESMVTLQGALRLLEHKLGSSHLDVATAKQAVGRLLMSQGRPEEAVAWANQARAIREGGLGALDPAVAESLELIGTCLVLQGKGEDAESLLREALSIYEQSLGSTHPRVGEALVSLGEAQGYRDSLAASQATLEQGLAILESAYGPDSIMATRALSALGYTHLAGAEWSRASQYFERSLAIFVKELGDESQQAAEELLALGIVRNDMGDHAAAAALEARAAATLEHIHGPWHPQLGRALRHLAVSLTNLGRFAEAEPIMLKSLAINERHFNADSYAVGNAYRSIGSNYQDAGKYEAARTYSLRALEIFERIEPTDEPSVLVAAVLGDLGRANRGLGNPVAALSYAERGLEIHQRVLGDAHPDNAIYLTDIARILFEIGQYEAARKAAQRADAINREHLRLITRVSPEEQALAFAAASRYAGDLLISAISDIPGLGDAVALEAWDSEIRARGQILDGLIERRQLLVDSKDPDLAESVGAQQIATERLAKLVLRGPGSREKQDYRLDLEAARTELRRAEAVLAAHGRPERRLPLSNQVGLRDVRVSLPPQSAMVAFVRYGHFPLTMHPGEKPRPVSESAPAYVAFILPANGAAPIAIPLGDAALVDALVARWRSAIANEARAAGRTSQAGEASYRVVAEQLRRAIWDPLIPRLEAAEEIFIVPDGTLNLVNFGALPAADGKYLVEAAPRLHYLSAERDITVPASRGAKGGLLAFSAPDFDDRHLFAAFGPQHSSVADERKERLVSDLRGTRSACGTFQAMRFEALPESAIEALQIVTLWQQALTEAGPDDEQVVASLSGSGANEAKFKQLAPGHRVIHVATHGFFLGDDCGSGEPAADDRMTPASYEVTRENPLLLSGLVLAGANHRHNAAPHEQDGILTAQEVATLDLRGTEWAVLSACDTGTGQIRAGEGVFGLRRAFQLAGARTVIMSLWSVEDEATRQWMAALYRHRFVEGKSTMASVQNASLELLRQRRARGESTHPFYWAGFIAAGDWR